MKIKSIISSMLGGLFISIFILSNAMAEEVDWLNNFKFIGGQNVKVSHGSPVYPGSIVVDVIPQAEPPAIEPGEPVVEIVDELEVVDEDTAEIIKRIKLKEHTALTSVTVCFRDYTSTAPFGINIYRLGLPVDALPLTVEEDILYTTPEYEVPEEECTVIVFDEGILPEGDKTDVRD